MTGLLGGAPALFTVSGALEMPSREGKRVTGRIIPVTELDKERSGTQPGTTEDIVARWPTDGIGTEITVLSSASRDF